jgi:ribosomal protein L11 methyltransferase
VNWHQIVIELGREPPGRAEAACLALGAIALSYGDGGDEALLEPAPGETPLWSEVRLKALFAESAEAPVIAATLTAVLALPDDAIHVEQIADRVWEREWLRDFRPMRFGQRLWVCPAGQPPGDASGVVIKLDPGLAFGTGTHATTALCLEWLDGYGLEGRQLLDYGCGSGILALAALALGAAGATAFDIDPQALIATRENAAKNALAARLEVLQDASDIRGPFDVVVANILAQPLVALAPRLAGHCRAGAAILLAGLLGDQGDEVARAYGPWFDIETAARREAWVTLAGRRRAE